MASPLERAVAIDLDGSSALEGIYLAGGADGVGAVVAPPHPLYGGSMDSPVVNEIAYACQRAGLASLRFNWRGVGASAGETSGEAEVADADYSAATRYLEECVEGPLVAAGYSFGAAAALRAASRHPRLRRLLLVSPPPALLDAGAFAAFAGRVLVVSGAEDAIAPSAALQTLVAGRPRASLVILPEVDHFYLQGLAELARAVHAWL